MKVLITGATGFIGSHVARLAVRDGEEVYALVRKTSNLWRIKDILPVVNLVEYDLLAFEELNVHLARIHPDLCIHLAWYAEPGMYLLSLENLNLLSASINLASNLANIGCRRFIGIGTCFEYDTSFGYLSESTPTKPSNLYAASKLAFQLVLEQLGSVTGMEVAWLRLFYQFGPFEDERRLISSVILSLLRNQEVKVTTGEQVRDYLYVEDVAEAIWAVAKSNLNGTVNIGSGKPITVRDIVGKIGAILNSSELISFGALPYNISDPMFVCANNRKLKENTTWIPRFDLEKGLHYTIEWWKKRTVL